ncbi:MFS general substrate transporter [Gonapodya prolifera JEL478]|uniref:MFS general substrate transporter n=1 Tax=Gonapodya prolifera (strain JEL478) TaxID=1344416 RepID=A0A139AQ62_GONPJ|nr:MFS general substrate transporter [Gonapodya prolifera JEL478]|eukprot:KXS18901.1 MFS general substrate transporter [Gonapodya prolifera JEL478]
MAANPAKSGSEYGAVISLMTAMSNEESTTDLSVLKGPEGGKGKASAGWLNWFRLLSSKLSPGHATPETLSGSRKTAILVVLTVYAFAGSVANVAINPSLLDIQRDLNTSAQAVNSAASVGSFVSGVAPLFWAPLADVRGRRFAKMVSGPIGITATVCGIFIPNVWTFYLVRIFQQVGASAVLASGAGTIADIYPRESRGSALGHFYLGLTGGAATGSAVGGVIAQYLGGWRATYVFCAIFSGVMYLCMALVVPETLPTLPTGVKRQRDGPLRVLQMNLNKVVLAIVLLNATTFGVLFTINVTIARDFPTFYNFTVSQAGYVQLFMGTGMLLTTFVSGQLTDRAVRNWKLRRNGVSVPEDRLRSSWIPLVSLILGCLIHGWSITYRTHWAIPSIGAWLTGFGMMGFGTPLNSYLIDLFATKAASIIAAANFLRFTFASIGPLIIAPAYDHIGSGMLYTLWAIVNLVAFCGVVWVIYRGTVYRSRVDPWVSSPAIAVQVQAVLGTLPPDVESATKPLGGGVATVVNVDPQEEEGKEEST